MINWIRRKLGQGAHAIGQALDWVRDVFVTIWTLLGRVFSLIRRGWEKLGPALWWFADAVGDAFRIMYIATHGIIAVIIPHLIRLAINALHKVLNLAIGAVRRLAVGLFRTLRDWASRAINAVRSFLNDVWDWTRRRVNDLLDRARRIWDKVADLVLHPERLWAWLFPHVVRPLLAFLRASGVALGRWLLESSVRAALVSAHFIESIIVKLL